MNRLKPLEFRIKAAFFALFRVFLKKGRAGLTPLDGSRLRSVLFLRPDRLGDTICSFPLIDEVKRRFPQVKIGILASDRNIALIRNDPRFDKIFIYRRSIFKDIKEVGAIRKEKFGCVVDLLGDDSVTTLFLSQLCSVGRVRIGVGKKRFARYYDYNHDFTGSHDHIITINLQLLKAFALDPAVPDGFAPPFIPDTAMQRAKDFLDSLPDTGGVTIGINLSVRLPNRIWGYAKSKKLVEMIREKYPNSKIIILTSPPDRHKGDELQQPFADGVYQVPERLSIIEASAVIANLDLLITADTAVVHIARSFRVPVVGMYPEFSGVYRQWRPYGQEYGLVLSPGGDDIFNITPGQAFAAFETALAATGLTVS
ncbi:MAG: glycosyltransferase family 9 protein [candidate division Zixibacteria bacterium]|nr:glycosyltransferase family 9 protein [candidate division Zixibacteria bacterium]